MPQGGPQWGTELDHLVRWMVGFPHLQRHFFFVIISNLWDDALCEFSMPNDPMISASWSLSESVITL